ncbi:uncharacterized protein LOC116337810 isoform X4 [Contarinia nasturtii]|uniref:uncharacterized protein LOC116337810 isoform X4 n=1 Tax=Contarinia nasturtii TaxID=265458 RepID=UPI0012D3DD36|nr:uncharacterized protein LOC116337810 isoform X4 [Contarinia nasturtii]
MASVRIEWVEIIEPRTREHMYANLTTGECVWDPPEGVNIKRTDDSQWWELFDKNTKRFYYYNVASQTTAWHRPTNCDIIPLAKLQTLKQNTDPNDARDDYPSSSNSKYGLERHGYDDTNRHGSSSNTSNIFPPPSAPESRSADILSHISERHNSYSRLSPGDSASTGKNKSHRYCRHTQGSTPSHGGKLDSGKSSDSSLSSSYRHGHDSGSLRVDQRSKHLADNTYRKMQESSSSHSIPHVALSSDSKAPSISYSTSQTTDISSAQSSSTPQFKKKLLSESGSHIAKHQSFDYAKNSPMVSLVRSGSFMSTPKQTNVVKKGSIDGNGGGASDDSMHEKYFKSVENTPVSKRRNQSLSACTNQKHSSDSSPHSPMSPKKNTLRTTRPTALTATAEPFHLFKSSQDNNSLEKSSKHERLPSDVRYLEKMRKEMPNKTSPSNEAIDHSTSAVSISKINNLFKPSSSTSTNKSSTSSHYNTNSIGKSSTGKEKSNSHTQYMDRYNSLSEKQDRKTSSKKTKKHQSSNSDVDYVEYDNDNMSPLYSNWDQETHEHLLPLQHYIIEQAKLSGSYHMGDTLDSDSLHSDSQSEHSFSGHEPDNEDSDHSDSQGDYLAHHYSTTMDDYGEVYYNVHIGYERNQKQDNISEEVEHRLERECGQIYSPIKNHPFFQQQQPQPQPQSQSYNSHQSHQSQQQQQQLQPKSQTHQTQSKTGTSQSLQSKKDPKDVKNYQKIQQQFSQPYANLPNIPKAVQSKLPPTLPIMKECNIEKFAQDNLNLHSKGIFRKKSSIRDMLSWTPDSISRPMLAVALSRDKATKKMATEMFKLIQIYMGDRKARDGMSLNSVAMDIITTALAQPPLRDELYIQLCRQTTENHIRGSLIRGWELLAICLSFLPPSPTFQPALLNYMNRHRDPTFATTFPEVGKWPIHVQVSHYATVACRRLERIGSNGKKQAKKPTEDEIEQSREQIIRKSMFGNTLDEVMELQKDRFPYRKLPWIQVTLSQQVLLLNGTQTEGIFRVSADVDEVAYWKARLDRWDVPEHKSTMDAHAPASLLKLWYRELYDPLIPDELYEECVATEDPETAAQIVNRLPQLNKLVLTYLVYFLQQFAQPDIVASTKMDSSNLAMVFAPNCLRCTSQDPKVILENARKEMAFMRTLISHMDTASVANME